MWELGFLEESVMLSNEFRCEVEEDESVVRLSFAMRRDEMENWGRCGR